MSDKPTNETIRWIPCKERLPEKTDYYLLARKNSDGKTFVTLSYFGKEMYQKHHTHWMPIPMPPEGDEG